MVCGLGGSEEKSEQIYVCVCVAVADGMRIAFTRRRFDTGLGGPERGTRREES